MTNATLMSEAGHSELVFWDNPGASSGCGGWRGFQDAVIHVKALIHVKVCQNPPQYCKDISLQLKLKKNELIFKL